MAMLRTFLNLNCSKVINPIVRNGTQIQRRLLYSPNAFPDEEIIENTSDNDDNLEKKKAPAAKAKPKKKFENVEKAVLNEEGDIVYTKMKNHDSRVSSILTYVKNKTHRKKRNVMMLEGKRLIRDALMAGCSLHYILFSRKEEVEFVKAHLPRAGAHLYKMPYREIQMWSELITSPGIIGLFAIPEDTGAFRGARALPLTVVCDNIRDPTNLGAILRTCSGAGCERVILTKGCTDMWDPKVLRSAAGSHFRLCIEQGQTWEEIRRWVDSSTKVIVADSKSENDKSALEKCEIPIQPYWDYKFDVRHNFLLVIGGETEGISAESYKLAVEFKGVRLNVPLENNVDSLNTNTALAVFAFEIKRQFAKYV